MAQSKGQTTKPQRVTAPVSNKAPRILVTESNKSVEWQVEASGAMVISASYAPERAISELALCDGLLITGGGDVNPDIYGAKRNPQNYGYTASRDLRELALLGAARDLGIPVLGICRGMQIINVEGGGTLHQHIPAIVKNDDHGCSMMPVRTVRGSLVSRTLGANPTMLHLHHQAVRRLAKGFEVTARHTDGTVEAMESVDGRVIGVQFHPESTLGAGEQHNGWKLFDAFADACTRHRRRALREGRKDLRPAKHYLDRWPVAREAFDNRTWTTSTKAWAGSTTTTTTKTDDKGKGGASKDASSTVAVLPKADETDDLFRPVAFCPAHGVAFDFYRDYQEHVEWFGCD